MPRPIHFEIPADDPQRAIAFYTAALGWQAEKFEGMEYWMMTTGNQGEPGIDGGIAPRRIEKAGGTITIPRMPIPGVGWAA